MKISYNWLLNYFDELPKPEELSFLLTDCGLEVESLEPFHSIEGGLQGVVIGHILQCEKHPNADKLHVTKVDVGQGEPLSIVCGAPNVAAGQKVLVATIGTKVTTAKGEFVIQRAKLRGELSEGMICAEDELGLGSSHAGIMVLPEDAQTGMPAKEFFKVEEDHVFEIGLTPNRSDATSHLGVARDIQAVINGRNMQTGAPGIRAKMPSVDLFKTDNKNRCIPVTIEDSTACPRYSGVTISDVCVGESPDWLKNKLKAIGLRPINNIVDITNFVLFETGQPLHAFDADKISGQQVVVKKLPSGTPFTTLDGVQRTLSDEDLMICNAEEPMCMAGVFGGEKSGVTAETTCLFLESACFDPATIRKTSRRYNLKTDAAFRFERGSDINMTLYALKRASLLICELAGGKISSDIVDVCPGDTARKKVCLTYEGLNRLSGKVIDPALVKVILKNLDINIVQETATELQLEIPTAKVDVTREADVVEEILRIYGYGNIEMPENLRTSLSFSRKPDPERIRTALSDLLSARGYHEILTNSLTASLYSEQFPGDFPPANNVNILNPLSKELNVMRQSLLFSGLEVMAYNQNRKASDLCCYEFGKVYTYCGGQAEGLSRYHESTGLALFRMGQYRAEHWREKERATTLFDLKADVELLLQRLGIDRRSLQMLPLECETLAHAVVLQRNGKEICRMGAIQPAVQKLMDLKSDVFYACLQWDELVEAYGSLNLQSGDIPKFPAVRRDLALLMEPEVSWSQMESLAYETAGPLLRDVNLFDIYSDEKLAGKRSYALSFLLQDTEKTLTDEEIERVMKKLVRAFETRLQASLR